MTRNRSKYQRCSVCNFGALTPSQYVSDRTSGAMTVLYNSKLADYFCTDCEAAILTSLQDFKEPTAEEEKVFLYTDDEFDTNELTFKPEYDTAESDSS